MAGRPRLEPDTIQKILDGLSEGKSQSEVAAEFGISQPRVSQIQKKTALNGGCDDKVPSQTKQAVDIRGFVRKAGSARDDAIASWRDVEGRTSIEWELAIEAAEGAASAWAKAAAELKRRMK